MRRPLPPSSAPLPPAKRRSSVRLRLILTGAESSERAAAEEQLDIIGEDVAGPVDHHHHSQQQQAYTKASPTAPDTNVETQPTQQVHDKENRAPFPAAALVDSPGSGVEKAALTGVAGSGLDGPEEFTEGSATAVTATQDSATAVTATQDSATAVTEAVTEDNNTAATAAVIVTETTHATTETETETETTHTTTEAGITKEAADITTEMVSTATTSAIAETTTEDSTVALGVDSTAAIDATTSTTNSSSTETGHVNDNTAVRTSTDGATVSTAFTAATAAAVAVASSTTSSTTITVNNLDPLSAESIAQRNAEVFLRTGRQSHYPLLTGRDEFFFSLDQTRMQDYFSTNFYVDELREICMRARVPEYTRRLHKKDTALLLANYAFYLKSEYQVSAFNALVDICFDVKPQYHRLPHLPPMHSAIPILNRSLQLSRQFNRPPLPFQYHSQAGIKSVTGQIFLEAADLQNFCVDFFFEVPRQFEPERVILLCLYQCSSSNVNGSNNVNPSLAARICTTNPILVPPKPVDLTLNGQNLNLRNRFRGHPVYDISSLCRTSQPNRLRVIKLPPTVDSVDNLVLEVIGIVPTGGLAGTSAAGNSSSSNNNNRAVNPGGSSLTATALSSSTTTTFHKQQQQRPSCFGYKCLQEEPIFKDRSAILSLLSRSSDSNAGNGDDDDVALANDTVTLDLRCPITLGPILRPVRFAQCKHPQCFDYAVFCQFSSECLARNRDVKCPVCFAAVSRQAVLLECGWTKELLEEIGRDNSGSAGSRIVKVDLSTGQIVHDSPRAAAAQDSNNDGSDGEGELRQFLLETAARVEEAAAAAAASDEAATAAGPKKTFVYIDLCSSSSSDDDDDEPGGVIVLE